jgi:hypothetical protein
MKRLFSIGVMAAAIAFFGAAPTSAATVTVTDLNTTVSVSDTDGMTSWVVDGQEMMFQQWFWFRVGEAGGEQSISSLSNISLVADDVIFDAIRFYGQGNGFDIEVVFLVNGGLPGSLVSDVAETITISNTGATPLSFHFFQYSDFDLCGSGDDTATFDAASPNQIVELSDPICRLTETVVTPAANHREAGFYPGTLGDFGDGNPTTLSDNMGAGPGDVTWAYQWDFILGAGQSFQISKDKNIQPVPEPASLVLLGAGMIGVAAAVRRRRAKA